MPNITTRLGQYCVVHGYEHIVKLRLPNQRAYEVASSICLLRGYGNFDEFVNEVFLDSIEIFPDGRDDLENVHWGFKNREEKEREENKNQRKEKILQ